MMNAPYSDQLALIRHFDADTPLAYVHGRIVTAEEFIRHATELAAQLPPAKHVINLCEDRYHFLLGFAAALIRRQVTLLPSSRAANMLAQLAVDFDDSYCLSDQVVPAGLAGFDLRSARLSNDVQTYVIPALPADQVAAILFTSGSTGQPTAHTKTWGMWVRGADQLQRAFSVEIGSCVIGSVAPQHMFGMESTIVHPLQWGCMIHHARPHLPADIEQAAGATDKPVWLMTTPLHLRACAMEHEQRHFTSGIAGVISATMPLDQATALAIENSWHCPVHEIYGCTEAGMIATRRQTENEMWNLSHDFRLHNDGQRDWLEGPRVTQSFVLSDRIVQHGAQQFSLQGRLTDMIKIAGKRTSLATLDAALLAIDGVIDGAFHRPASRNGDAHDDQRLTAFFVSDYLTAAQVIDGLRRQIDPVFIPRPITKVASLPRDANGKLPLSALLELAGASAVSADDNCTRVVPADHPALAGHFPGNPIVPGLLLLNEVMNEVMRAVMPNVKISGIRQVKFHAPLKPEQPYAISFNTHSITNAAQTLKFAIHREQILIASGVLQLQGAADA